MHMHSFQATGQKGGHLASIKKTLHVPGVSKLRHRTRRQKNVYTCIYILSLTVGAADRSTVDFTKKVLVLIAAF